MAAPTLCDQCGVYDLAPKSHWFPEGTSFHHDCLSASKKAQLVESNPLAAKIIEAAENGTRNDDLRAFIEDLHKGEAN